MDSMSNSTYDEYKSEPYLPLDIALYVYTGLILGSIIMSTAKNVLFYKICMNASKNLHNSMFACMLRAPMRFFDVNPSGNVH